MSEYRKKSFSERDKGFRFECLMQAYLQTDPIYAPQFKNVWLWNDFPFRKDFGGSDVGIDLVVLTHSGDYWAIQCKCFDDNTYIDKPAVDSFITTSGRSFKDNQLKSVQFSQRLWISTTNKWSSNATDAISGQNPPVTRINLHDLETASVDWAKLNQGIIGEAARISGRTMKEHQQEAVKKVHDYFSTSDRGKLIMACGTGKTFTALRIAENETQGCGLVLFLVPSIALLGQTLREWTTFAKEEIRAICICSDAEVSKKKSKDDDQVSMSVIDLALPASTNVKNILHQFNYHSKTNKKGMTIVFSTYQSIDVIAAAQKELKESMPAFGTFDLIICDEAHRTTGVTLANADESTFTKVHDNDFLDSKKRLYMTATPRLYDENAKSKAVKADAILCSMDDVKLYGEEIYRIGFGEAVEKDLLTDYKVLILTLNETNVPSRVQKMFAGEESEISVDDLSKLVGCINALSKQIIGDDGLIKSSDPTPMKRAVAFCQSIAVSKTITSTFNGITEPYIQSLPATKQQSTIALESKHIDGTMSAPQRDELLGWLKADTPDQQCRVLTNVRCLSEGVDVPSLDAVMFLSARNSKVDVVQSVGRVMRKSPGKKYGYIIIPVVIPADVEPDKALDDNVRYKVVWDVLNALRAHDDRFNAIINKIELSKSKPAKITVGGSDTTFDGDKVIEVNDTNQDAKTREIQEQLMIKFEELQTVIFAKMVQKVGDRRYWEQWANDVAQIAERHIERMKALLEDPNPIYRNKFNDFLKGLHTNINTSISQEDAIEMLAQHLITKPVFEALFENYQFADNNPVSRSMQGFLAYLAEQIPDNEHATLEKFYDSVKKRVEGITDADSKQRIIVELYDKFFKAAFPKMVEKLGIVYTPIEVVDFIIHSVQDILKNEFNTDLNARGVQVLDPFTGTGTFIVRLLQSGLLNKESLLHKYKNELHANEIVLLAYYIATINIENAFHDLFDNEFVPFNGICLTDTFQLNEIQDTEAMKTISDSFPENSERIAKQKRAPIRVIIGNPPYSIGQKSANDNAQNESYPLLDSRISETYAKHSSATSKKSLYDAYVKGFRWASDRIDPQTGGIIAFVTNGAWLEGNTSAGFRKCIEQEFDKIYVFNLRGNQRTSGELSKKEGGKIFGSGSRTPIAITILVKKGATK